MSEFKGIKWNYDINANKGYYVYLEGSVHTIALVLSKDVSYMPNTKESESNAKLIACAPEMLEMLLTVRNVISNGEANDKHEIVSELYELIKKATS